MHMEYGNEVALLKGDVEHLRQQKIRLSSEEAIWGKRIARNRELGAELSVANADAMAAAKKTKMQTERHMEMVAYHRCELKDVSGSV